MTKPVSGKYTLYILLFVILLGCQKTNDASWEDIFNGKDLAGWDTYLAPRYKNDANPSDTLPLGLNNDPDKVFSVVTEDGQPAIHISGENHGGLSTTKEFKNYHFVCEFKWGEKKTASFKDRRRDSGILYHAVGPHGVDSRSWMRSQEFQIEEGDCGDYWGVAGGTFDIPAVKKEKGYVYDPHAPLITFSEMTPIGRYCIKNPDAEKPTGQWNTVEFYCMGDTAVHIVNGVVNMILYHSRQYDKGQETPLKQGKIQLQSEGCEVYYRNLRLEPIKKIPNSVLGI